MSDRILGPEVAPYRRPAALEPKADRDRPVEAMPRRAGRRTGMWTAVCRATVLGAGLTGAAGVSVLVGTGRTGTLNAAGVLFLILVPAAVALALVHAGARREARVVRRLAGELVMLGVSLVVVEAAMVMLAPAPPRSHARLVRQRAAERLRVPFDGRSVSDVVAQLRAQGIDALPGIGREWASLPTVRAQLPDGLYPLSHASGASVVECNERGQYLVYRTDESGFNNPPGLLAGGRVDIAVVGESHALGHCLPQPQSLLGLLRGAFPRTANFGMAGSRIMAMLGTFREYVEPLRPPLVLWVVTPRFVEDNRGLRSPILSRYLDPGFSQHLRDRQDEVDRAVRTVAPPAQAAFDRRVREEIASSGAGRLRDVFHFSQLTTRLRPPLWRSLGGGELGPFLQVVTLASETTRRWGGEFVVIIAPMYEEVVARTLPPALEHDHLARVLAGHGIPVIDSVTLFLAQDDPAGLYTMRMNNHPTAEGYALLADDVIHQLQQRFPRRMSAMRHASPDEEGVR